MSSALPLSGSVEIELPFEPEDWIGREVGGRFKIDALIASGGMGAVFSATHRRLGHRVAVKVLLPHLENQGTVRARFEREALAMAQLDHPHVASALDFGEVPGGSSYMIMPLVRGESLGDWLENEGPFDWRSACLIAAQVADALSAAHAQQIVHRDLKPDNILLERGHDGSLRATVLDFGIARVRTSETGLDAPPDPGSAGAVQTLTRLGTIMGTPGYMSPEQGSGQVVDHRTDIYALGVVLWEMIMGTPLWAELDGYSEILTNQLTQRAPTLDVGAGEHAVPPQVVGMVAHLLEAKAERRPSSAAAVRDQLRALAYLDTREPESQVPLLEEWKRKATIAAVAATGVATVLVATAFGAGLVLGSDDDDSTAPPTSAEAAGLDDEATSPAEVAAAAAPQEQPPVDSLVSQMMEGRRSSLRRAAARTLLAGDPEELPDWVVLVARFEIAQGCNPKRAALAAIAAEGDERAAPAVSRIVRSPRRGCGTFRRRDCHACYRSQARETLAALE